MNDKKIECFTCGACCIAYDISSLNKPASVPCKNLRADGKCGDYENRPQVCRDFKADNTCVFISSMPLNQKVEILKKIYES